VRIIGGAHRGRALASIGKGDAAAHLRPTSDRVREALFNVLAGGYGDPASGARVLDLFAGTGALGLEALSRGAATATFVESGRTALSLLRENIARCGAGETARVLPLDARRPGPNPGAPHDLVFLDPPYGKGLGEAALGAALAEDAGERRRAARERVGPLSADAMVEGYLALYARRGKPK